MNWINPFYRVMNQLNMQMLYNLYKEALPFNQLNGGASLFLMLYFSFLDNCNACLKSFSDRDGPYNKTPPRYTRAASHPKMMIVRINILIDRATSHIGTLIIPTLKNIIIGAKNGMNDVIVINFASGIDKPTIAIIKAIIISIISGKISCCTSSTRLTNEPSMAAIVAYNK